MTRGAVAYLKRTDPVLRRVIARLGPCRFAPRAQGTHFEALLRAIVYQQLSGKAAATIHGRVVALCGGLAHGPVELSGLTDQQLRDAGLSRQKIAYIRDLAAHCECGALALDAIEKLSDDDIMNALVQVKGIGRWTAQMFLMFRLGRPDVLPDLDLGIQKGVQIAYDLESLPSPKDILRIGAPWSPHSTTASWYMWRLADSAGGKA